MKVSNLYYESTFIFWILKIFLNKIIKYVINKNKIDLFKIIAFDSKLFFFFFIQKYL